MIKKLIYILLFLPLTGYAQYNFYWSHSNDLRCLYDNATYLQKYDDGYITEPHGLFFKPDGKRMFVVVSDKFIRQYSLATPWDISTASYDYLILLNDNSGKYYGICMSADGYRMYAVNDNTDKLEEYDLSAAWDIWDFDYVGSYVDAGDENLSPVYGCCFSENGEYLIMSGFNTITSNSSLKRWHLSTPWDTSTASLTDTEDYGDALRFDIQYNKIGNAFFSITSSIYIRQETASPAWSITNLKGKCFFDTGVTKTMYGMYISPGYSYLYLSNTTDDEIYQYKLFEEDEEEIPEEYPIIAITEAMAGGNLFVSDDLGESWTEINIGWTNQTSLSVSIGYDINNIVVTGNTGSSTSSPIFWSNVDGTEKELVTMALDKRYWGPAHCSIDGEHFYWGRGHTTKYVYYSLDAGDNYAYTSTYIPGNCYSIASSSNNNILYMGSFTSNYSIKKFTSGITGSSSDITIWAGVYHAGVACSSDGQKVYVTKGTGTDFIIAKSSDGLSNTVDKTVDTGVTSTYHRCISCSADGKYVLATSYPGRTYVSDDYGDTWTEVLIGESYNEYHVYSNSSVSYSGKYMIMGEGTTTNQFYLSTDYGETWSTESTPDSFTSDVTVKGVSIQEIK